MSLYCTIHMIPYNYLGVEIPVPLLTLAMISDDWYLSACTMLMLIVNIFANKDLMQKHLGEKFSFR